MRIYLVRHGQTEWNKSGRWQGHTPTPLDETGLRQAKAVGERFKNVKISVVWSSDLLRATQTAEFVAKAAGVDLRTNKRLREVDLGEMNGKTEQEVAEMVDLNEWWRNAAKNFGGESPEDVTERVVNCVTELARNEEEDFAVVSHRMAIRCFVCGILGVPKENSKKFHLDNTSISVVDFNKETGQFSLVKLNDNAHLEGLNDEERIRKKL